MAFHPTAPFVYVIDELVASITAFSYDAARGTLTWIQTVSTLPPDFTGPRSCAQPWTLSCWTCCFRMFPGSTGLWQSGRTSRRSMRYTHGRVKKGTP